MARLLAQFIAPGRGSPGYNAGMSKQDPPPGFRPANFSPGFLDRGGPYWLGKPEGGTIVGLRIGEADLAKMPEGACGYHDERDPSTAAVAGWL